MGFEDIIRKIKSDAEQEAQRIIEEAKKKREQMLSEAKKRIEEERKQSLERIKKEAEETKRGIIQKAKLDSRKKILETKQKLIDEIVYQAEKKLLSMNESEFIDFYSKLILNVVKTGSEEVLIVPNDREKKAVDKLIEKVNGELKNKIGEKGQLKFSGEVEEGKGGVVVRRGQTVINLTVDALLRTHRDKIEVEVAKVLFKQ